MNRVVIFLDIDGVLNSTRYWSQHGNLPMNKAGAIDEEAIERLNRIVEATGATVVISSSWRGRNPKGTKIVGAMLKERGFRGTVVGQTIWLEQGERHEEIWLWLSERLGEWDRFVVIDDSPDAWSETGSFNDHGLFASTNYLHGLVDEHIDLITRWANP